MSVKRLSVALMVILLDLEVVKILALLDSQRFGWRAKCIIALVENCAVHKLWQHFLIILIIMAILKLQDLEQYLSILLLFIRVDELRKDVEMLVFPPDNFHGIGVPLFVNH